MTNPIPSSATPAAGTEAAKITEEIRRNTGNPSHEPTRVEIRFLLSQLDAANETLAKLRMVVELLPVTMDRVPIVPGMDVWRISQSGCINMHRVKAVRVHPTEPNWLDNEGFHWGPIYSTPEAAAAGTDTQEKA